MHKETEYKALRTELIKHIELRHSILTLTVTAAGTILGFSNSIPRLALLYPIIALIFCCLWAQNEMRELQLCDYISKIEEELGFGWSQFYKSEQGQGTFIRGVPFSVIVPGSTFVITSLIAILIYFGEEGLTVPYCIYAFLELLLVVLMIIFTDFVRIERLSRRDIRKHIPRAEDSYE